MKSDINKSYYIITPSVSNLGGAQLYIIRRVKYLIKKGYCVKVIVSRHNSSNFILENHFAEIPILYLNQLQNPISFYSEKEIDSMICTIQLFFKDFNNGIIESSSLQEAVWGELIASKFNLKHIVYLLAEPKAHAYYFYPGYAFFLYKLNRGEFYGTTNHSLSLIFDKKIEKNKNNFINVAFDPSELTEVSTPQITSEIDKNSFIIGTITRLEKTYVAPFLDSCIILAKKHLDKQFTIIVAGGSEKPYILNHLKATYCASALNPSNINIIFTGYIKTLGKDFFKMLHVFVGQGTASINAISQGCATLNIDPITNKCSGIFGVEIDNFAYPKEGKIYEVADKLESLMLDAQLLELAKLKGAQLFNDQYSIENCFNKLDNLIYLSGKEVEYYPIGFSIQNKFKDKFKFIKGFFKTKIFKFLVIVKSALRF